MEHLNLEYFFNLEKDGTKSAIDFCMKMGLISNTYECPGCKCPMKLSRRAELKDGLVWCCRRSGKENAHLFRRSIRSGSWFENSSLSFTEILKLTYLWVKKTSHEWITDELKLSRPTVTEWMKFCRKVCVAVISKENISLGGPGKIIEIDASRFSGSKVTKRKKASGNWVFGGVERGTNKCFLEIIQNGDKDELSSILRKYVLPGTTIVCECWKGYNCLEDEGYVLLQVDCSSSFKDSKTGEHINTIKGMWNHIRRALHSSRLCHDQFDTYLAEFMWRRLHQEKTQELLRSFFKSISEIYIPRIKDDSTLHIKKSDKEKKVVESIEIKVENFVYKTLGQNKRLKTLKKEIPEILPASNMDYSVSST